MNITWETKYETGISEIDAQHKHLFTLVGQLGILIEKGSADQESVQSLFEELQNYVRTHFYLEELLMENNEYPDLEEHRKVHTSFEIKIGKWWDNLHQIKERDVLLATLQEVHVFLQNWLVRHILHSDMEYVPALGHLRSKSAV